MVQNIDFSKQTASLRELNQKITSHIGIDERFRYAHRLIASKSASNNIKNIDRMMKLLQKSQSMSSLFVKK